jgi:predicted RNase H-like HicB family nuclease
MPYLLSLKAISGQLRKTYRMKQNGEVAVPVPAAPAEFPATKDAKSYLRLPYARILIPETEGGFFAEILEFPGCVTEGETPDEAFHNLESVAESWIESCIEQGQDIPPPSANHRFSGKIALRLPRDLHRLATYKAQRDGVSVNQVLVTAIAAWVGADNLVDRLATKIQVNFVQANFINWQVPGEVIEDLPIEEIMRSIGPEPKKVTHA